MILSEKELIQELKCGEEKAYRSLYETHYEVLCRIAREYLKDDFLAETIVGDTIFNLWEKRLSLEIQTSLRAYLVRAVRNRCINYLQLSYVSRETRFQTSDDSFETEELLAISDNHPLDSLIEKELELKISECIEKLPEECRTVFELSRFNNLKYSEISEKLNISVNTVKYHIKNALSKLSTELKQYLITWLIFYIL